MTKAPVTDVGNGGFFYSRHFFLNGDRFRKQQEEAMLKPFQQPYQKVTPSKSSRKSELAQFMTPPEIAQFMASLFASSRLPSFHLLDPGAGKGALSAAFMDRALTETTPPIAGKIHLFEKDQSLLPYLHLLSHDESKCSPFNVTISHGDFIDYAVQHILFKKEKYTHAILNPPYKKIRSNSLHRLLMRDVNVETVNLYSGFVALAIKLLKPGGELVAIVPRSFCNGPYYRNFRSLILSSSSIKQIHLFKSRNKPFKDQSVLQENVIIYLEKSIPQGDVSISSSTDGKLHDFSIKTLPFNKIVLPEDEESFIHIPIDTTPLMSSFTKGNTSTLNDIGVMVSTGPVVDFRAKEHLRSQPSKNSAPLLYPGHFTKHTLEWPKENFKKPNAIARNKDTQGLLYPRGYYTIVRRFSSKEEPRRVVARVVDPNTFPGVENFGFENHLNVFHNNKNGLPELLALGLTIYLNSTVVDSLFRQFNGHTQVNATDLRILRYPDRKKLLLLGRWAKKHSNISQDIIDKKIEALLHEQ